MIVYNLPICGVVSKLERHALKLAKARREGPESTGNLPNASLPARLQEELPYPWVVAAVVMLGSLNTAEMTYLAHCVQLLSWPAGSSARSIGKVRSAAYPLRKKLSQRYTIRQLTNLPDKTIVPNQ